jgi:mRNA interferase MazF
MPSYQQGDIVLIPFPFTDFSQTKNRPAIIVGNHPTRNNDYIVAKITSNLHSDSSSFLLNAADIVGALPAISEVRSNELMTVAHKRVIKKYATLDSFALKLLCEKIKIHFAVK